MPNNDWVELKELSTEYCQQSWLCTRKIKFYSKKLKKGLCDNHYDQLCKVSKIKK
ncbi:hypothetical protein SCHRY_v1c05740 [Spiroplasma chrysopicola DF-1]|uniref:Uncharacterized protein n=1 Tax=Spiroplasma chrysopicola DF-1 TaxID=1276227 RepID=R4U1H4_9MOLU|nr:hypothetical protein SCHRY_v1c05740 [Spiroplasma chrysopicola DF-1]